MPQSPSINRPTVLAVAALALILPLSAVSCSAAQKAIDCGNTAITITSDVSNATAAFNNANNDPTAAGQAMQQLKNDIDKLNRNSSDTDVSKALGDLQTQVQNVQHAIDNKQAPDLQPLGAAAGNLSKACTG
ncbi:hypothetical protein AB0K43_15495 [Kitasatospora sp. NPDC049258]|uniref:hypothetical protein n=1 Tax=Kitasatospora sp. NPDC049258 TaxID=3155394 RepID=UPI003427941F